MKKVVLLGCTGSIGTSSVKVVNDLSDRLQVVGLGAGNNVKLLMEQTRSLHPKAVSIQSEEHAELLRKELGSSTEVYCGEEGLIKLATLPGADIVLISIIGTTGLKPALAAIRAGKDIALASKEVLVVAGEIVMSEAKKYGVNVLTVDSEHSAIFQCLEGRKPESVRRLILTASGGPFRKTPKSEFANITLEKALKHPSWSMGRKITLDSATLFNKGLEMIEARWLFNMGIEKVSVLVHPQSIVHSMVEFVDGSILAQLSTPDMCLPIQYALTWPERRKAAASFMDFAAIGTMHFEEPDPEKLPCLRLAMECAETGGTAPCVMSAANEIAVGAFLGHRIGYNDIYRLVASAVEGAELIRHPSLEEILLSDAWAREHVRRDIT